MEQLKWSRFVNVHGVRGRNIPLDLHQEHLNRLLKGMIKNFGVHKKDEAIVRSSKALGTVYTRSFASLIKKSYSSSKWCSSLNSIIKVLKKHQVFDIIPGRKHASFPKPTNLLHSKPKKNVVEWLVTHVKKTIL